MPLPFFTVGHSSRPLDEFLALLAESEIAVVADVRRLPGSRAHPHYDGWELAAALAEAAVDYVHLPALGGRRSRQRDVPPDKNAYWENTSFHNYADYALGGDFHAALIELRQLGRERRCAVMCAEAVWWKCHRRIITDYLIAGGETVFHILGPGKVEPAHITAAAHTAPDERLTYPMPSSAGGNREGFL